MGNKTLRFKITTESNDIVSKHETTEQVYSTLLKLDTSLNRYFITDVYEDIEVDADDFVQAWQDGERPGDLQMF